VTNFAAMGVLTFGIQAFITLLVIIDPPGATPIFLALSSNSSKKRQRELAWQAATVSFGVIIAFAIFGKFILDYLHISVDSLTCRRWITDAPNFTSTLNRWRR
jgi:multiple antibiotic resistance protein